MSGDATATARAALRRYLASFTVDEKGADSLRVSALIRIDCPAFEGHFPGNPILAGAFQLWIARLLLAELLESSTDPAARPLRLVGVTKAKFRALIRPGDAIRLTVALSRPAAGEIDARCRIEREGAEASRFTLRLGPGKAKA